MKKSVAPLLVLSGLLVAAAPAAAQDAATAIRFSALHIDCSSSVGTSSFTVTMNGTPLGTFPFQQGCACNSAPLTATINDPAILALAGAPACSLFSVTVNDPQGGAYVGYAKAEIDRTISGTETICIKDYNGFVETGGTCGVRDACTGYKFSPGTFTNSLPDADGDALADCTDPDDDADGIPDGSDNCVTTPNAGQEDANGDGVGDACEPRAITVPWLGVPTQPHQVYDGGQLILQGTVRLDPSFTITAASWDPGDGTGVVPLAGTLNPRALELAHTYSGADGTPYIAVLSATVTNGTLTKTVTDTFRVVVRTRTLDVETNMAIDRGLWYLHKQIALGTGPTGAARGNWTSNNAMAATASAVQALLINNHRETGDRDEDPYVDDVARGLVYLFEGLAPLAIAVQTAGDPDTNANGIGLTLANAASEPEGYILGQVVDAIVASGTPAAVVAVGNVNGVRGRTYRDIVQDLMDAYNWGQGDPTHGARRGGWWYDLNTGADTSASQWGAIAGLAAESWGVPVPAFVKSENLLWVDQASFFDGSNAGIDGRFDYDGGNGSGSIFSQSAAEATSGLVLMAFGGIASDSAQFKATERYISRLFYASNVWDNERHIYGMYAMAKGFRLANPPVTTLDAAGNATPLANFDWYRSPGTAGSPKGVARILIDSQQASGRWDAAQWVTDQLATAWAIIILSPTIFELGPTATCDVEPSTTGIGGNVEFDASGSFHNDPGGTIVAYDWAFQDSGSASGQAVTHSFGAPGTYNVVLTVTDANGLTDTETCPVNIVQGALPPNSDPNGPYVFCPWMTTFTLDGTGSSDPDGAIVSYEWDWTPPLNLAPADASGATVDARAVFAAMAPGTYDVALRVTDNNTTQNTDFTTVTVYTAANCPIEPDTDGDGVPDSTDNCPQTPNADQADADDDGAGDVCDNCPIDANADQADEDDDGIGDVCDGCRADADCSDGLSCTTDLCDVATGICSNPPVVCPDLGQCFGQSVCDEALGCAPVPLTGDPCDDGNECTQVDVCQDGVCAGGGPVECAAQDQCHVAGQCNPATGVCSNPPALEGTACTDGDACTRRDICDGAGACVGMDARICEATDQCHEAGRCDPATGACSNPAKPDRTPCDDGSLCTGVDACVDGVCTGFEPVVCRAQDQCHVAGSCDPATGRCDNPDAPDGTACSDSNTCTEHDECRAGRCVGGAPPEDMACFTVKNVKLKLPARGGRNHDDRDDDADEGCRGGRDRHGDHDDDGDDDHSFDEGMNHVSAEGTYGFNDCSGFDPRRAGATVELDGKSFTVPDGGFREIGRSGKFRYRSPRIGHGGWELVIDTRSNEWKFEAHHLDRAGLEPADGLTVTLRLGGQTGSQTVALRGSHGGVWRYEAPRNQRHCAPPRDDDDDDCDRDSDERDSGRDDDRGGKDRDDDHGGKDRGSDHRR